ncbi:MAG: endonuclease MutS2 [Bacteroidota bacterium]
MADFSPALKKLEFDKILKRISQFAATDPGKTRVLSIMPSSDSQWIIEELKRVDEAKELLIAEGHLPLDGLKDIRPHLKKASVEHQALTPGELLDIATCLRISRTIHAFLHRRKATMPGLALLSESLLSDKIIEYNISNAIDESGSLRDSASKELQTARRNISSLRDQLRKRLSAILRQVAEQDLTQEDIITTRDGRFVIPVKTEYKHRVPGFIHSTSSSGATVFIEPAETLDLNNGIRELQFREQREVERILRDLTGQAASVREPLLESLDTLAKIDLLAAKAKYSIEILGSSPRLSTTHTLDLQDAYHPILLQSHDRASVIPLAIRMGGDVKTVIITGPNAGGKSVALKTVGLSLLLTQAGIHIPASADSEVPLVDDIFVDIGDDQSIENDLSTFSSHLLNLRSILEQAGTSSFVLIDEIGAGTDPAEGGALASSVLKRLNELGSLTIATTHHGMLKVFAHETPGMANASMEFDRRTLTPTYRFHFGVPGSSYALELAERMEFDRAVLEDARQSLGEPRNTLESLILALEAEIQKNRDIRATAESEKVRLSELMRTYESKLLDVRHEIKHLRTQAREDTRLLVEQANATIEQAVRSIRESAASKSSIVGAKQALQEIIRQSPAEEESNIGAVSFRKGDIVKLRGTSEIGELTGVTGDTATVLWKNGTMKVQLRDLEPAKLQEAGHGSTFYLPETQHELDVRGLSGDEAVLKVGHFLDDAWVSGLRRVDIIHGKGTGVLRKRITTVLKTHPRAKSFRLGEWNEGGSGVTVVELAED